VGGTGDQRGLQRDDLRHRMNVLVSIGFGLLTLAFGAALVASYRRKR
jgi:hypothetical protein